MFAKLLPRGSYYRKSLITILLIASIPGFIAGLLMYRFAGEGVEGAVLQLHNAQMLNRANQMADQFTRTELTLSSLSFDPLFDYRLLETDFYRDFETTRDITKILLIMNNSLPVKSKVELYLNQPNSYSFTPHIDKVSMESELGKQITGFIQDGPAARWMLLPSATDSALPPDLVFVNKLPGWTSEPFGILIARADPAQLQDLLKSLTPYEGGEALLLHEDGSLLSSSGASMETPFLHDLKTEVAGHEEEEATFMWSWKGNRYSVSYGNQPRIGAKWTYISAAPIDAIYAPVVFVSKLILLISCTGLLAAAILAWLASKRMYSPLARILELFAHGRGWEERLPQNEFDVIEQEWLQLNKHSRALQERLESQLPQVSQGFLYQLVSGHLSSYTEEELRERMRQYGWLIQDREYQVLYIQLSGMFQSSSAGRFALKDEGLVSFAAANIAEELAEQQQLLSRVINFHDLSMGIIVESPSSQPIPALQLHEFAKAMIEAVQNLLKLQTTVAIGASSCEVKQISWLMEEARSVLCHRKWDAEHQILEVARLQSSQKTQGGGYPYPLERELLQAARAMKRNEAENLVHSFLQALTGDGATDSEVRQGVMNLLGALEHEIMQSGLSPNQLLGSVNRFEQLASIQATEQIQEWFVQEMIKPYIGELENRAGSKNKKIVEKAMLFIGEHYMRDFSLDECAKACGTNAFLLSRSFKQVLGSNFIDYITDTRIEKAKLLLRDSEQQISDIAEQVGYQVSYFNRLFKRCEGITPSQYRERIRDI